eukprot:scaffold2297_cov153-Ochromonas_danica.AAC.13
MASQGSETLKTYEGRSGIKRRSLRDIEPSSDDKRVLHPYDQASLVGFDENSTKRYLLLTWKRTT